MAVIRFLGQIIAILYLTGTSFKSFFAANPGKYKKGRLEKKHPF